MRFLLFFCVVFILCGSAQAQAQVTVTELQTLSFGSMIANPAGDTITVNTSGNITAVNGSDLQGGNAPAIFRFEGPASTSISYSFSINDTLTAGGESVNLGSFQTNRSNPFSLPGSGVRDMSVGADIIIPASLNGGAFSGNYTITIDNP